MATKFVVVGGSLDGKFSTSGQVEVDQILVPDIPHSGGALEDLFADVAAFMSTCKAVDASGKVEGTWLQGDPPTEVSGTRPLTSGRGYAYTVGLTVDELRAAISTGIRGRYSQATTTRLKKHLGVQGAKKGRRPKGFSVGV